MKHSFRKHRNTNTFVIICLYISVVGVTKHKIIPVDSLF